MNKDVSYSLDKCLRENVASVKNIILKKLNNTEIFLFGSIAKGLYSKNSDIDLLVLINENKTLKELRELRHELEDLIDEMNVGRNVDIKLYNKDRYEELCESPCFERDILKYLVDIKEW